MPFRTFLVRRREPAGGLEPLGVDEAPGGGKPPRRANGGMPPHFSDAQASEALSVSAATVAAFVGRGVHRWRMPTRAMSAVLLGLAGDSFERSASRLSAA